MRGGQSPRDLAALTSPSPLRIRPPLWMPLWVHLLRIQQLLKKSVVPIPLLQMPLLQMPLLQMPLPQMPMETQLR